MKKDSVKVDSGYYTSISSEYTEKLTQLVEEKSQIKGERFTIKNDAVQMKSDLRDQKNQKKNLKSSLSLTNSTIRKLKIQHKKEQKVKYKLQKNFISGVITDESLREQNELACNKIISLDLEKRGLYKNKSEILSDLDKINETIAEQKKLIKNNKTEIIKTRCGIIRVNYSIFVLRLKGKSLDRDFKKSKVVSSKKYSLEKQKTKKKRK